MLILPGIWGASVFGSLILAGVVVIAGAITGQRRRAKQERHAAILRRLGLDE